MINNILFALWFFLPAGVANVAPVLAAKAPLLKKWTQLIDDGRTFRGKRLLGDHKTWRGIVCGVLAGTIAFWIQIVLFEHSSWVRSLSQPLNYAHIPASLGPLMSFGALAGDALKSFFKRQIGFAAGRSWLLFDQLDYIIGGLALSAIVVKLSLAHYVWIFGIWFVIHLVASYIGYLTKHKDTPI